MIAEHLGFCGNLNDLISDIPHRQKLMWLSRIHDVYKDVTKDSGNRQSVPSTPETSLSIWSSVMVASQVKRQ